MDDRVVRWLGWGLYAGAALIVVFARIKGCHMTEGEQLVAMWDIYLAVCAMSIAGTLLLLKEAGDE